MPCARARPRLPAVVLVVVVVFPAALLPECKAETLPCISASPTLADLVDCFSGALASAGSDSTRAPSAGMLDAFEAVVLDTLHLTPANASAGCVDLDGASPLAGLVSRSLFSTTDGHTFCVVMETQLAAGGALGYGLGLFVANPGAVRDLHFAASHPLSDSNTEDQCAALFQRVQARSVLVSGTRRDANTTASACQGGYFETDAAHNTHHAFFRATKAMLNFHAGGGSGGQGDWAVVQMHGMGASSCPDVSAYITHGHSTAVGSTEKAAVLRGHAAANAPAWTLTLPTEDPPCSLHGTQNTEGRLLNGVPPDDVCTTPATTNSGHFLHIEQKIALRQPDAYDAWAAAFNATWPARADDGLGTCDQQPSSHIPLAVLMRAGLAVDGQLCLWS